MFCKYVCHDNVNIEAIIGLITVEKGCTTAFRTYKDKADP